MQEGLYSDASYTEPHGKAGCGGLKRTGGEAKGIPRNWLTMLEDEGREVVVPATMPESTVAEGEFLYHCMVLRKPGLYREWR